MKELEADILKENSTGFCLFLKVLRNGKGRSHSWTWGEKKNLQKTTTPRSSRWKKFFSLLILRIWCFQILLDGLQEFSESEQEKYTLLPENKVHKTASVPCFLELLWKGLQMLRNDSVFHQYLPQFSLRLRSCHNGWISGNWGEVERNWKQNPAATTYRGIGTADWSLVEGSSNTGENVQIESFAAQTVELVAILHLFSLYPFISKTNWGCTIWHNIWSGISSLTFYVLDVVIGLWRRLVIWGLMSSNCQIAQATSWMTSTAWHNLTMSLPR